MSARNINSVFYAYSYHPIQAGSIDGTDVTPHDGAVYRALLCSSAGLYDPLGDPKITVDPYCTLFVGRLSHQTTEETLRKAMSKYGRVKNLRLVRDIVTGASRGYAFVEYETEREMHRAYEDAHHSYIDDREIIVDYNRQQLMPGWIPRRLGGGLGGRKESGQLRFGGRDRPFRAPLRPIPYDELKRLGIPPPPEGKYMSRFQVPSPPRRERSSIEKDQGSHWRHSKHSEEHIRETSSKESGERRHRSSMERDDQFHKRSSVGREERYYRREERPHKRSSIDKEDHSRKRKSIQTTAHSKEERYHRRSSVEKEEETYSKRYKDREKHSHKHHKSRSHKHEKNSDRDRSSDH